MVLVENLTMSDGNFGEDYDRSTRDSGGYDDQTRKYIKALHEKFDKMMQATQRK